MNIRQLHKTDNLSRFDCGDDDLTKFLRHHAKTAQVRNGDAKTYLAMDESGSQPIVLGYDTLAIAELDRALLTGTEARFKARTLLLARLATDITCRGKGVGSALMAHAL